MTDTDDEGQLNAQQVLADFRQLRADEARLNAEIDRVFLQRDLLCLRARRLMLEPAAVAEATGWDAEMVTVRLRDYPEDEDEQLSRVKEAGLTP